MNKSLLPSALCASTFGIYSFASVPAPAQTLAAQDVKPSGAALFNRRALLKVAGPDGSPFTRGLAPDENLRRWRLTVARDAPALAKLREALAAKVTDAVGVPDLSSGADARELARQLTR